ncbi:unnamed protein product [Brachionus calyciflorus]|uniref:Uncharacterized protein n=1 Tax=Brachionus calyciflorus TaxID=104777 RepID=A0A814CAE5_9BILA|nr:unnamed protein product [Brachionus calyciflorus]
MNRKNLKLPLISVTDEDLDQKGRSCLFYLNENMINSQENYKRKNTQFQRRRESLSLFTLASSTQNKFDLLNKLNEEALIEKKELDNLYKCSSFIINRKHLRQNSPIENLCFATNSYENIKLEDETVPFVKFKSTPLVTWLKIRIPVNQMNTK